MKGYIDMAGRNNDSNGGIVDGRGGKRKGSGRMKLRENEVKFSVRFDKDFAMKVRILYGIDKKRYGWMSFNTWLTRVLAEEIIRRKGEMDLVLDAIYRESGQDVIGGME